MRSSTTFCECFFPIFFLFMLLFSFFSSIIFLSLIVPIHSTLRTDHRYNLKYILILSYKEIISSTVRIMENVSLLAREG